MNFEPLYELKNRLENVAVVGINLAKDDFRLQRAVEQVKEYSTVAKVFKQIYDMGNSLISTDDEDKCDIFLDLLALLDAVLCTQATTYSREKPQEIKSIAKNKDFYKELHYSELSPLIYAFTQEGGGRLNVIEDAIDNNSEIFDDFRLKSYMINGLSDKYSEIVDRITRELRKQRKEIIPLLKDGFDPQGKREMLARLDIISHIGKENENDFYKYCIENGSKEIKEFAIGALKYSQDNIDYILDLTKTEKGKLKNKAFEVLSYMNDSRAEKEWDKFFKKKPLENIEYLRGTDQQWATDYLNNFIGVYIEELKNRSLKTAEERRIVENEVTRICSVILNKRTDKILSLFKDLYPYNKYEIKKILSFYIVTDLNKELTDLIKELARKYEGEFLEQEFLISLIKDKPETVYKNFSKYAGVGGLEEEIKKLFNSLFKDNKISKNKEEAKAQEEFRTLFNVIFHIYYNEESKEYILQWSNMITYNSIQIKLSGFDKRWYNVIFELDDDYYEKWNYYSSYNTSIKRLYNPDIKGMKEKYGAFYYNIVLSRIPYSEDIEFLNKLGWTDYIDFLKGNIDIEKNPSALASRIRYINYILKDIPISETELKKQLEEIIEMDKKAKRASINLCKDWLEKLNNGAKVKEL
ncbi:hypothetical protein LDJ90_07135 [Fusobacterium vincentii]|uniref:HEAT repeat domain-containing protein n=1 Tax=Fusobacterium nucleatum TaxID=851 RepID=A0AAX3MEV1_FUSNU|nr:MULTISPECIES: hypothetical protein [Fusobacterium]ATV06950.1 hypothetical protein CS401_09695 [Fusobacterium vincentii]WDA44540.1 hypothetical protein PSR69_02820 [Fusobacterium nucleatum]BET15607.1 hypothetical protein FVTDC_15420 [Fusobacterium vincentii]